MSRRRLGRSDDWVGFMFYLPAVAGGIFDCWAAT
jgi:hypothetical protein